MNRKIVILLTICLAAALTGCGSPVYNERANANLKSGSNSNRETTTNIPAAQGTDGVTVTIDSSLNGHTDILKIAQVYLSNHLPTEKVQSAQIVSLKPDTESENKLTGIVSLKVEGKPNAKVDVDQEWHGTLCRV